MGPTLGARAPIDSLSDVETFLSAAQHLKALTLQYLELRSRQSRREHSLQTQIDCITDLLADKARGNPRVLALWLDTVAELQRLAAAPPRAHPRTATEPCNPEPGARVKGGGP